MSDKARIQVWSTGYEGRFLEWSGSSWQAYEHYNYRHHFKELRITDHDLSVLRGQFGVSEQKISNRDLVKMPPERLCKIKTNEHTTITQIVE